MRPERSATAIVLDALARYGQRGKLRGKPRGKTSRKGSLSEARSMAPRLGGVRARLSEPLLWEERLGR